MKRLVRIIKLAAIIAAAGFSASALVADVGPFLTQRMDDFPVSSFSVAKDPALPTRRTQFVAEEIIRPDMPLLPLNTRLRVGKLPPNDASLSLSFLLHIKPQIAMDAAFEEPSGDAVIMRFASTPDPRTLSLVRLQNGVETVAASVELPNRFYMGQTARVRFETTPGDASVEINNERILAVSLSSQQKTSLSLSTTSIPVQIDELCGDAEGGGRKTHLAWTCEHAPYSTPTQAAILLALILALGLAAQALWTRALVRCSWIDALMVAAPGWLAFPIVRAVRIPWPPFPENYPVVPAAAIFILLQGIAIALFLPRRPDLAPPPQGAPSFSVLMTHGGKLDLTSKAALVYELFGAIILGVLLYRNAPPPIGILALFALICPGLTTLIAAAAWKTPSNRTIPFAYPLFLPVLSLFGVVALMDLTGKPASWAWIVGVLLSGAGFLLAATAWRYRKGSHYWAPLVLAAAIFSFYGAEMAARLDGRAKVNSSADNFSELGGWRIGLYTNLLGNNAHLERVPTGTGDIEARKTPGTLRVICLGSSPTAPGRVQDNALLYPGRLEHYLNDGSNTRWETANAGLGGANDLQLYVYLRDILMQTAPDIVTFYYGRTDPDSSKVRKRLQRMEELLAGAKDLSMPRRLEILRAGSANPAVLFIRRWESRSSAASLADTWWEQEKRDRSLIALESRGVSGTGRNPTVDKNFEKTLSDMARLCQKKGARFVMIPHIARSYQHEDGAGAAAMRAQDGRDGAVMIDLLDDFRREARPDLFYEYQYMTEAGHDLFARLLAARLRTLLEK